MKLKPSLGPFYAIWPTMDWAILPFTVPTQGSGTLDTSLITDKCDVYLFANACAVNTDGPNNALPIATDPLRYFMSDPGAAEYMRLPTPVTVRHTNKHGSVQVTDWPATFSSQVVNSRHCSHGSSHLLLRLFCSEIIPHFTNISLTHRSLDIKFNQALVTPLIKDQSLNKSVPSNYHPIS